MWAQQHRAVALWSGLQVGSNAASDPTGDMHAAAEQAAEVNAAQACWVNEKVAGQIAGAKFAFCHDAVKNATLSRMPSLCVSFEAFRHTMPCTPGTYTLRKLLQCLFFPTALWPSACLQASRCQPSPTQWRWNRDLPEEPSQGQSCWFCLASAQLA